MNEANVHLTAEKANCLLLLELFCYSSSFIFSLIIKKNKKVLEYPLYFFLTCSSLPTYQEATALGSCLHTKEDLLD